VIVNCAAAGLAVANVMAGGYRKKPARY